MRLDGINAGDLVRASVRGRLFHARVVRIEQGALQVEPIERGISERRVRAREVLDHWRHAGRPRAAAAREHHPGQASFDHLLDP